MLRIHISRSAAEAKSYFITSQSKEAYYSEGQEFTGLWGGKGAELLGLKGRVDAESFERLCDNLHPETGKKLTVRMNENRRAGFDLTFDCPKSVSLLYAYTRDERIVRAVRQAVNDTMQDLEECAAVRTRAGLGKSTDQNRTTGNLVWGEFVHLTARPEDGFPDPQLHWHMYVFNASFDEAEGRWKALQIRDIHDEVRFYEGLFNKRVSENLRGLGLEIVAGKHSFEIGGINRELIERFSRRTKKIEDTARRLGITDPEQKAKLGAMTRASKTKTVLISELEPLWWGGVPQKELEGLEMNATKLRGSLALDATRELAAEAGYPEASGERAAGGISASLGRRTMSQEAAESWKQARRGSLNQRTKPGKRVERVAEVTLRDHRAVALAMKHLFERQSVVTEKKLIGEALHNWCVGWTTEHGIKQAVAEANLVRRVIDGKTYVTTREIVEEEERIKQYGFEGRSQYEPMNNFWRIEDEELTHEQKAAVFHVLNSKDFLTGISGNPGVGKTRALKELKRGIEAGFNRLLVLAPWGVSVHDVLRKSGFTGAETVAKLLSNEALQKEARGAVWLVDEAGLLSCPEADRLLALARRLEARVVLVGDAGQHHAVQRGQAFELLEKSHTMSVAKITQIQRQKGEYKRIVELILERETDQAIDLLREKAWIREMSMEDRVAAVAAEYANAVERGESTSVLAPTHVERHAVEGAIREELKQKGILKPGWQPRTWTQTQKMDPAQYRRGLVVEIEEQVKGFRLGEQVEVVGVRDDLVRVRGLLENETRTRALPLDRPEAFRVHETQIEKRCEWEVLRKLSWTEAQRSDPEHYKCGQVVQINGRIKGFERGEQVEVISTRGETIRVRSKCGEKSEIKQLPVWEPGSFDVYEKETIEICEGERIRITGNGRSVDGHPLNNGSFQKVDHIDPEGKLVLENGCRLDRTWKHLEYSYTLTSHASQGMTVDRLFIMQSAELSYWAIDAKQFLVSISRGCKEVNIYTDDIELLRQRVANLRDRMMATGLLAKEEDSREMQVEKEQPKASDELGKMSPEWETKLQAKYGRTSEQALDAAVNQEIPGIAAALGTIGSKSQWEQACEQIHALQPALEQVMQREENEKAIELELELGM